MSAKAVVAIHGDGNLSNYLARLSISKIIYSATLSFIHSACFPDFDQFYSSCRHTPRFIDIPSVAGPKITFSTESSDNLHWLMVAIGDSPSPVRYASAPFLSCPSPSTSRGLSQV